MHYPPFRKFPKSAINRNNSAARVDNADKPRNRIDFRINLTDIWATSATARRRKPYFRQIKQNNRGLNVIEEWNGTKAVWLRVINSDIGGFTYQGLAALGKPATIVSHMGSLHLLTTEARLVPGYRYRLLLFAERSDRTRSAAGKQIKLRN